MSLNIYIDTNIFLNSILDRDNGISKSVLSFLAGTDAEVYLNDISFLNIHYVIKKSLERTALRRELKILQAENKLVSVDAMVIDRALESRFKDFEDAVQYYCAQKIQADLIITDNIKDFKLSDIPVMTAQAFYAKYLG